MVRRQALILAAMSGIAQPGLAAVLNVDCPPLVYAGSVPAPGFAWEIVAQKRTEPAAVPGSGNAHPLRGMQLYSGHPRGMAALVPDDDKPITNGARESTWRLVVGEHWVSCSYPGASLALVRALPASVSTCRMTYRVARGEVRVMSFACREEANLFSTNPRRTPP